MEPFVPPAGTTGWLETLLGAGLFAKFIILVLFFFSVIAWSIIIKKILLFRAIRRENKSFLSLFEHRRTAKQFFKLTTQYQNSPLAKVLSCGITEWENLEKQLGLTNPSATGAVSTVETIARRKSQSPSAAINLLPQLLPNASEAMNRTASAELERVERFLPFLATVGSVSPFIGLLGTVWGVLSALINIKTIPIVTLQVIAPGVSDALVTTVAGLIVAIPAVIFYNYFVGKTKDLSSEIERFISLIIGDFRKDIIISQS
ncbi:MAG: MotA/TolQ/ExbB proton channel family protein [bacterium]